MCGHKPEALATVRYIAPILQSGEHGARGYLSMLQICTVCGLLRPVNVKGYIVELGEWK